MKSPVSINLATGLFLFMKSGGRFSVLMFVWTGLPDFSCENGGIASIQPSL